MNTLMISAMDRVENEEIGEDSITIIRSDEYEAEEFNCILDEIVEDYQTRIKNYENYIYDFQFDIRMNNNMVDTNSVCNSYDVVVIWKTTMPPNPFSEMIETNFDD